jgi:chromosome segregation ATPase
MNENQKSSIQQYTAKVTTDVKRDLADLKSSGDFKTDSQMLESLIEAYNYPRKADASLNDKIKALQLEISDKDSQLAELERKCNDVISQLKEMDAEKNILEATVNDLQAEIPADDTMVIPVSPFNRKVLEVIAERENKNRKRTDITPEILPMFVIEEVLVKCNAFSIDALSNSEKRRIKEELQNENNA